MRVDLLSPIPTTQPEDWPASLFWTPEWATLLDPDQPAVLPSFTTTDEAASASDFEADDVAALLFLLHGRIASRLRDENDALTGAPHPPSTKPHEKIDFWRQAVGVVTPHRAQQGFDRDKVTAGV